MLSDVTCCPLVCRQHRPGDAQDTVRDDAQAIGDPCLPVLDVDVRSDAWGPVGEDQGGGTFVVTALDAGEATAEISGAQWKLPSWGS